MEFQCFLVSGMGELPGTWKQGLIETIQKNLLFLKAEEISCVHLVVVLRGFFPSTSSSNPQHHQNNESQTEEYQIIANQKVEREGSMVTQNLQMKQGDRFKKKTQQLLLYYST